MLSSLRMCQLLAVPVFDSDFHKCKESIKTLYRQKIGQGLNMGIYQSQYWDHFGHVQYQCLRRQN
jgi:hypothetical protein